MSRTALLYAWLSFPIIIGANACGCQAPAEVFHLSGDASLEIGGPGGESSGTGGEAPGTGGAIAATGGMVGSGGAVGSGGVVATGGATGGGGAGVGGPDERGGAVGGRGGAMGGRSGAVGGRGGAMGGRSGAPGGRGGASTGSGGAGGASSEKILSIDFGVGGQGAPAMAATEMAGVKPARRWNSAVGASGALSTTLTFADASPATGTMVAWMSPAAPPPSTGISSVGLTDTTGDGHMMDGYLNPGMAPGYSATITVSGLRAPFTTSGYDVYVYFMANLPARVTRSHKLTIGTKSFTVSQTGASPTKFTAHLLAADRGTTGDYVVFTNVTGATFTLTSDSVSATDGGMRAPVNGIQIVWPTGS